MVARKYEEKEFLPGLSALNRNTTYPLFGTAIVSFSGGKLYCRCNKPRRSKSNACFKLIFLTVVSGDRPIPITLKPYPCKWKGWLRFGCWTEEYGKNLIFSSRNALAEARKCISLFTFIDQYNFNDCIHRDIDFVCAHAIWSTIGWSIVSIAKLFRIDFVELGQQRCGWR